MNVVERLLFSLFEHPNLLSHIHAQKKLLESFLISKEYIQFKNKLDIFKLPLMIVIHHCCIWQHLTLKIVIRTLS